MWGESNTILTVLVYLGPRGDSLLPLNSGHVLESWSSVYQDGPNLRILCIRARYISNSLQNYTSIIDLLYNFLFLQGACVLLVNSCGLLLLWEGRLYFYAASV